MNRLLRNLLPRCGCCLLALAGLAVVCRQLSVSMEEISPPVWDRPPFAGLSAERALASLALQAAGLHASVAFASAVLTLSVLVLTGHRLFKKRRSAEEPADAWSAPTA